MQYNYHCRMDKAKEPYPFTVIYLILVFLFVLLQPYLRVLAHYCSLQYALNHFDSIHTVLVQVRAHVQVKAHPNLLKNSHFFLL